MSVQHFPTSGIKNLSKLKDFVAVWKDSFVIITTLTRKERNYAHTNESTDKSLRKR